MNINFSADIDVHKIADSICENDEFVRSLTRSVANDLNTYEIASELSVSDIAYEIDTDDIAREIAGNIDDDDIARCIDLDDLAASFDTDALCEKIAENMQQDAGGDMSKRVQALETQVQSLLGLLDYVFTNARKGITLVDAGTPLDLSDSFVRPETPAQAQPTWEITEIPNYL